jgi:hypothetical protein
MSANSEFNQELTPELDDQGQIALLSALSPCVATVDCAVVAAIARQWEGRMKSASTTELPYEDRVRDSRHPPACHGC